MKRLHPLSSLCLAGLLAASEFKDAQAATFSVSGFVDETIYQGNGMISMRFDFAGRLWVCEKQGRILVFTPTPGGSTFGAPVVFADLSAQVNTNNERGMTGLTLDPDFANNRYVYVLFATNTDQRILRLTANTGFTAMIPGSEVILLSGLPNVNGVHKAGDIDFHPSDPNNLYVMIGDDGDRTLVGNLDLYNGKLLKISASDGKGLTSNPYYNGDVNSVRSRIWSARYRNPFRFTFDPAAPIPDVLYVSENGDGTDRIARIEKGADGGWDNQFTVNSADGKRRILQTSAPSKTGIAIFRSGPLSVGGAPTLYNGRYGAEIRRWTLTGAALDTLTAVPADGGAAFYSGFTTGMASFTAGPDGALYYTESGQGPSTGTTQKLGRIKFVGGTQPVANFTASPPSGQSPLQVTFTDTSTAPSSSISSWAWDFGDGANSNTQNPTHDYAQPGIYAASLTVTNAQGLTHTKQSTVTAYHQTNVTFTGRIYDGRSLPAADFGTATELRFYQKDGTTPLAVSGGSGANGNVLAVAAGGVINVTFTAQITGNAMVVSAGEAEGDGVQPALVGVPLSITAASQNAGADFYLSDTMLRGRVTDTKNAPARVDVGIARGSAGSYYAFAGGRDFLGGSGISASGEAHRAVADALGYYHVPIRTGGGNATFYLDTSADTLTTSHGRVNSTASVATGQTTVKNLTIGLYHGGTGEADLSGIAVTPDVDFATQIQPIFTSSCAACHNDIATNSGGLDLEPGDAYGELVGKESTEAPGVLLVQQGSASRSYLMEKLSSTVPQVGTSMRPGDPMPLAQQALIRDWINQLTPPDPDAPPAIDSPLAKSGQGAVALTYQMTANNLPTSFGATDLPPGLAIDTQTGLITGIPTQLGTFNATITATNANGTDTETLVFTITAGPLPAITSALGLSGPANSPLAYTITATNNATVFGATGLPPGLTIDTATGVISGTPTAMGNSNVTITAANANGTDTETLVVTVHSDVFKLSLGQPVTASTNEGANTPANGNDASTASNGTRWAASSGAYPQWWRVDLGEPKVVTRVDINWYQPAGRVYKYRIEVSNDDSAYTTVVDKSAASPGGNTITGLTSDTLAPAATARYVRITVTGSNGGNASFYDCSVFGSNAPPAGPPSITSALTANGTVGSAFTYQIVATNSPTLYGAAGLPAGLSINTATGAITGMPTSGGTSSVTITATNDNGTDTETLVLTIAAPPVIAFSSATYTAQESSGTVNAAITVQRLGSSAGAMGVTVSTAGGTAVADADYTAGTATLSWADGDTSAKTFIVPVLTDTLAEGGRTVLLQLSAPTGGASLGTSSATLTILDRPFDAWRQQNFGTNANSSDTLPSADFDDDTRPNLLEYAVGTNPAVAQPAPGYTVDVENGSLKLSFARPLDMTGLTLRVKASSTLANGSWTTIATKAGSAAWSTSAGVAVSDNPATGAVTVTDSVTVASQPTRFLRLETELAGYDYANLRVANPAQKVASRKRGVAMNTMSAADFRALAPGVTWYYNWAASPGSSVPPSDVKMTFIPMQWGSGSTTALNNYLASANPKPPVVFAINEPNLKGQAFITPQQTATLFKSVQTVANNYGIPVVGPHMAAGSSTADSITADDPFHGPDYVYTSMVDFLDATLYYAGQAGTAVPTLGFHAYDNAGAMKYFVDTLLWPAYGKPIWVTEFAYWDAPDATAARDYLIQTVDFLERNPHVGGYAFFKERSTGTNTNITLLAAQSGVLSPLGQVYVALPPHESDLYYRLPGRIPAENYAASANCDLRATTDADGAFDLTLSGTPTADYNFLVDTAGSYTVKFRVAGGSGTLALYKGAALLGTVSASGAGWQTLAATVTLAAGPQTLQLRRTSGSVNAVNWIEFAQP